MAVFKSPVDSGALAVAAELVRTTAEELALAAATASACWEAVRVSDVEHSRAIRAHEDAATALVKLASGEQIGKETVK